MIPETNKSRTLFLSKQVLQEYGCKNCVWKSYSQCPHALKDDEIFEFTECVDCKQIIPLEAQSTHNTHSTQQVTGYCNELAQFLFGLAEGSDSISAVKEKFMLYTQEMQAMADHMEYQQLQKKYKTGKAEGKSDRELHELIAGLQMYKLWWQNLTFSIVKGLSRIVDRERRSEDVAQTSGKITIQQLNVLLKESDDTIKKLN